MVTLHTESLSFIPFSLLFMSVQVPESDRIITCHETLITHTQTQSVTLSENRFEGCRVIVQIRHYYPETLPHTETHSKTRKDTEHDGQTVSVTGRDHQQHKLNVRVSSTGDVCEVFTHKGLHSPIIRGLWVKPSCSPGLTSPRTTQQDGPTFQTVLSQRVCPKPVMSC